MSEQRTHFEEEFRDGPPATAYQAGSPAAPSLHLSARPTYTALAGQKLVLPETGDGQAPGPGQRLALAIVSLVFVFLTFTITLGVVAAVHNDLFPIAPLAVSFALVFAVVVLLLNVLFSWKR